MDTDSLPLRIAVQKTVQYKYIVFCETKYPALVTIA